MTSPSGPTATEPVVRTRMDGQVLTVRLSRPGKRNAFNTEMVAAVTATIRDVQAGDDVRALVIAGEGSAFSAGADISEYGAATPVRFRRFTESAVEMCSAIAGLPIPVVAAVHGVALGGGFEVVLSCDLVVATRSASFGLPETSLGLIPGWGGTQALSSVIGPARTKALVFTGDRLTAQEAFDLGVVHQLCDDDVVARAEQLAASLTRRAPSAIAAAKRAIEASAPALDRSSSGHAVERAELLALFGTDECREGIDAFAAKRPPVFNGNRKGTS